MTDMMYQTATLGSGGDTEDNPAGDFAAYGTNQININNNIQPRQRFPGLYVGNLTWWTTDRDVIDAINSIGVSDVQEVKFFENRNNGQSKGFCMVTFSSETSLPIVIEKLPQKELHGQSPLVTPYNRQNLNLFEAQTKPKPQMNPSTNGPMAHAAGIMGINSITGVHATANAQAAGLTGVPGIPYAGLNATSAIGGFNQTAGGMNPIGGVRPPFAGQPNFRMGMRGPRAMMRGTFPGNMNNGPMMQGGHRMRFMQSQNWNNSQGAGGLGGGGAGGGGNGLGGGVGGGGGGGGGYNPAARMGPQGNLDISNRLGPMGSKQMDDSDLMSSSGPQGYHSSHHHSSQSDYRDHRSDIRDYRDLRDDRDSRRLDERSARLDERSLRLDDRSSRDDRSMKSDDRLDRHRRDDRGSSRRDDDRSSRHRSGGVDDIRRERDDRSSRRDDKLAVSSSRHKESRTHRSDERVRSRSRSRSKDRSREAGKERRSATGQRDGHRDRERERERDRRERR